MMPPSRRCRWRRSPRISRSASPMARASPTFTAMEPTERAFAWLAPSTFFLAVLRGIRTVSSWSWPKVVCPLRSSSPITVKGTFLMRITWPSGSPSPNRLLATVWPRSATLLAPSISSRLKSRPSTTSHSRVVKYSSVTPWMPVAQLRLPQTTWALPREVGAAATTAGMSRWMAHASSSVMVSWLPEPMRARPTAPSPRAR